MGCGVGSRGVSNVADARKRVMKDSRPPRARAFKPASSPSNSQRDFCDASAGIVASKHIPAKEKS